jgi:hypothetical protein
MTNRPKGTKVTKISIDQNQGFDNQGYGSNQGASNSQSKSNIELMLEVLMTSQKKKINELNTKS